MKLQPYLNFAGSCGDAFRRYQEIFGGTLQMMTHGESPMADQCPPEMRDQVMHARLEVGDQVVMGSDAPLGTTPQNGGMFVSAQVDSVADAERVWGALADGAHVIMPLAETFWSPRFGMLVDRYGTPWMINYVQEA